MAYVSGWSRGTWSSGPWDGPIPVEVTGVAGTGAVGTGTVSLTTTASGSIPIHTDLFDNEKVWKSDGTFSGTCTSVTNATTIVFSGGLESAIANPEDLYIGTRYYVLKAVSVPVGQTLILDSNDINFNSIDYSLYITLGAGSIDLITRQ